LERQAKRLRQAAAEIRAHLQRETDFKQQVAAGKEAAAGQ